MQSIPYASVVGSVMYTMVCIRPYLAYVVSMVSRFMANPGKEHWSAMKWILRYIRGTTCVGILYSRDASSGQLVGYSDSDYSGDLDGRRSTNGYIFTLSGSPISWNSTLQSLVALSTTEVEYMVVGEATKEAIWLRGVVGSFGVTAM